MFWSGGVDDVARGQTVVGELLRIEPQAHRVLALAEDDDVADALDALEVVLNIEVRVVAEEERGRVGIVRREADAHHEVARVLAHGDAGEIDLGG